MKVKDISLPYIFNVIFVLCFTRPRYQVSVYRTIGTLFKVIPLVSNYLNMKRNNYNHNSCQIELFPLSLVSYAWLQGWRQAVQGG